MFNSFVHQIISASAKYKIEVNLKSKKQKKQQQKKQRKIEYRMKRLQKKMNRLGTGNE